MTDGRSRKRSVLACNKLNFEIENLFIDHFRLKNILRASFVAAKSLFLIMSRTTKKKFVAEEVLNTFDVPTSNQQIVKVIRSCGNNLHEVVTSEGKQFLASMPQKFRKHIWIKRGDFIVIDPIEEGVKVQGEISRILLKDHIKYFKDQGVWPKGFCDEVVEKKERNSSNSEDDLFVNTNRPYVDYTSPSSSEDEES